jgi:hypothetical protein
MGTAQAEPLAKWKVAGANVTSTLLPALQITQIENNTISVLTRVIFNIEILCTGIQIVGAKLEVEGRITPGFKIKKTGCNNKIEGKLSKTCIPSSAGQPAGTVETVGLKGLLVLHGTEGLIRIEPLEGENLIVYKFGEECALPESMPLKGKLFLTDCQGALGTEQVTHLFSQGALTDLFMLSKTAEHAATVDGSLIFGLTGAHAGLAWSGIPG